MSYSADRFERKPICIAHEDAPENFEFSGAYLQTTVQPAFHLVSVPVTSRHIGRGEERNAKDCPIARALREALEDALLALGRGTSYNRVAVSVDAQGCWMSVGSTERYFTPTTNIVAFVRAFDAGEHVFPFTAFVPKYVWEQVLAA